MHEFVKIFVFLFTFATTFLSLCQEYSLIKLGLPTSQPIAMDWEMLHVTSSVNGITAALQTPPQNCSHPSTALDKTEFGHPGGGDLLATCFMSVQFLPLAKKNI
jgi:hypothetical protein